MSDERKVVTVLFADCVGSTAIGEQLDPEELATVMRAFFDEMRAAVEAEGGIVEKFIGDAVMALFGAPTAHEDDPARALRCALDMRQRVDTMNARLEQAHGVRFGLRVGVNSGEVLVSTEPGADLGMVTGDAVNIAARLEQVAEAGQVVVAERTARAAREFCYEELGPLALRGKATPVRACLLTSTLTGRAPGGVERGIPGLHAPMVGREYEFDLLKAVVARSTSDSRPHLATVYGEAGVGKSRLVQELVTWAERRDDPPLVLQGRCLPYGNGATYWPVAEILKELAEVRDNDPAAEVTRKLRAFGEVVLDGEPADEVDRLVAALSAAAGTVESGTLLSHLAPREVRIEIHTAWRTVLSRLAGERPVLAVIEDIHWADEALLDLLEELAERAVGPIVLVCPSRPDLTARRPGWGGGRRNASAIALEPLSLPESSRLASLLLDVDALPSVARATILERAEGNPFFLEEILRQLIDEGRIVRDGPRWRAAEGLSDIAIPDSVQSVLAARIDLLPPLSKKVLQHAAVVGRVFWTGSLRDPGLDDLDAHLDVLEARDFIDRRLGSAFRGEREHHFRHILTCNVAYDSIPRRERANLHAHVAAWLDDVAAGREAEFAELLAHHWAEAHRGATADPSTTDAEIEQRRQRAYQWCLAAARENHRRAVVDRAEAFAQQAIDLAGSPEEIADAAAVLGDTYRLTGKGSPAMAAYRLGADALLAAGAADAHRTARLCALVGESVARWPGMLREPYDVSEIRCYLDEGLALAGAADSEARARLLVVRSMWAWGTSGPTVDTDRRTSAEREKDAADAADMAARLGLPDVESSALDALVTYLVDERRYLRSAEIIARRLALLPRVHDPLERGDILCMAASTYFDNGRYAEAATTAASIDDELDTGHWGTRLHAMAWGAMAKVMQARWDEVMADVDQATAIMQTVGLADPPPFACPIWATAAFVQAARGDVASAERLLALLPPRTGPEGQQPTSGGWVAMALARLGRPEAAERRLAAINGDFGMAVAPRSLSYLMVAEATGRWDAATAAITDWMETPDSAGPASPNVACAAELAGRRALVAGDPATGQRELERALTIWRAAGAVWPAARVDLAMAAALHGLDEVEGARRHATRALAVFESLGCPPETDLARELLAR